MKKLISSVLAVVMMFSVLSCFTAFAEEKYPPYETGTFLNVDLEKHPVKYPERQRQKLVPDESAALKIEELKQKIVDEDSWLESTEQVYIDYYGTLSDGSMLLYVRYDGMSFLTAIDQVVVGKYYYQNPNLGDEVKIYRDNKLSRIPDEYKAGTISDELLDEIAYILCYAEFINPNEIQPEETVPEVATPDQTIPEETQPDETQAEETVSENPKAENSEETQPTETKSATSDEPTTAKTANSNGSVQTGQNNTFALIAIVCVSIMIFAIAKQKNGQIL